MKLEELLKDYKMALKLINVRIKELKFKDDANPDYIRLRTKAGCYRTIITELKQIKTK